MLLSVTKLLDWRVFLAIVTFLISLLWAFLSSSFFPMNGIAFISLMFFIFFVSMCVTFVGLHKLLQHKEPVPLLFLREYLGYFGIKKPKAQQKQVLKANREAISRLASELDQYFVSKWYNDISKDQNFLSESRVFLEEVLTHLVDAELQVNNKVVLHGVLNVFLKHLKEFRRSVKRRDKHNLAIEDSYRYSHIWNTSNVKKPIEHFLYQLTVNLLRHFINSELWNSLPCHILVSILARKCLYYLLDMLSDPEILNYLLLTSIANAETKERLKLNDYGRISLVEFFDVVDEKKDKAGETPENDASITESDTVTDKAKENEQTLIEQQEKTEDLDGNNENVTDEKVVVDNKVTLRTRPNQVEIEGPQRVTKSPKKCDSVKIYEPRSSTKTWRDTRDLACISLGQDPLDALPLAPEIHEKTKHNFWETAMKSDEKQESPTSAAHIFNEVMHMTSMEGLKSSIKPISEATERTLHNFKDLQETTVHNALHKIGDFQDEAAGVVEGLLDFGRAGFRKGLRLTGLQDNIENAKATLTGIPVAKPVQRHVKGQAKKKKLEELRKSDSDSLEKISSAESVESVWINPLDSPSNDDLVISEKVNVPGSTKNSNDSRSIPSISTEQATETDSPDPEYEDTSDLATSIAKLRSLLQQRSSESNLSTPALSPMPDEYLLKQAESENVSDVEAMEVDGVMPNLYKFASGVFSNTLNTIKTALPGNNSGQIFTVERWKFKSNTTESVTLNKMRKLLTERKEYCVLDKEIDAGYDALDSVDIFQQSPVLIANDQFDDEFDDFEGKIPVTKALVDVLCELLGDTNSPFIQEPVVKGILLACGSLMERNIENQINRVMEYLSQNLISIPESSNNEVLSMDLDDYIEALRSNFPEALEFIVRKDTLKHAIKLLISSLQKKRINQDVFLQVFELVGMKLIEESTQISPLASA